MMRPFSDSREKEEDTNELFMLSKLVQDRLLWSLTCQGSANQLNARHMEEHIPTPLFMICTCQYFSHLDLEWKWGRQRETFQKEADFFFFLLSFFSSNHIIWRKDLPREIFFFLLVYGGSLSIFNRLSSRQTIKHKKNILKTWPTTSFIHSYRISSPDEQGNLFRAVQTTIAHTIMLGSMSLFF